MVDRTRRTTTSPIDDSMVERNQGFQFNYGPAIVHQTNINGAPSLDEDLRMLRAHDIPSARRWLLEQDDRRKKTVLNEYERAHELFNCVCAEDGVERAVGILIGMNPQRVMWLLERLENKYQQEFFLQLGLRIAREDKAAQHIHDLAKFDPSRAAHLLINIARHEEAGSSRAVDLLPSVEFIRDLDDEFAAPLLAALMFDLRVDDERFPVYKQKAYGLLGRLVALDVDRAAHVIASFDPLWGARCVRMLRLRPAIELLRSMNRVAPKVAHAIVARLPWPVARIVAPQIGAEFKMPAIATGWSSVDGAMAVLASLPSSMRRISEGVERPIADKEASNLCEIWAMRIRSNGAAEYRRQRNQLGALVAIIAVVVVILIIAG